MHDTCHKGVGCPCDVKVGTPKNGEADLLHRLAWQSNRIFASGYAGIACKANEKNRRGNCQTMWNLLLMPLHYTVLKGCMGTPRERYSHVGSTTDERPTSSSCARDRSGLPLTMCKGQGDCVLVGDVRARCNLAVGANSANPQAAISMQACLQSTARLVRYLRLGGQRQSERRIQVWWHP